LQRAIKFLGLAMGFVVGVLADGNG